MIAAADAPDLTPMDEFTDIVRKVAEHESDAELVIVRVMSALRKRRTLWDSVVEALVRSAIRDKYHNVVHHQGRAAMGKSDFSALCLANGQSIAGGVGASLGALAAAGRMTEPGPAARDPKRAMRVFDRAIWYGWFKKFRVGKKFLGDCTAEDLIVHAKGMKEQARGMNERARWELAMAAICKEKATDVKGAMSERRCYDIWVEVAGGSASSPEEHRQKAA